jgi:sarcosine oxidase subunit alpha
MEQKHYQLLELKWDTVAGSELDGRTIPYDNSLEGLLSKKKDFIGKRSLTEKHLLLKTDKKLLELFL